MIDAVDRAQDPGALETLGKRVNAGIDPAANLEDFSSEATIFSVDPAPPLSSQPSIEEPPSASSDLYRRWRVRARGWLGIADAVATEATAKATRFLRRVSQQIQRRDLLGAVTRLFANVRLSLVRSFDSQPSLPFDGQPVLAQDGRWSYTSWATLGKTRAAVIVLVVLAAVYGFAQFDSFVPQAPANAPETPRSADVTPPTVPVLAAARQATTPVEPPPSASARAESSRELPRDGAHLSAGASAKAEAAHGRTGGLVLPASPVGARSVTSKAASPITKAPAAVRRDERQAVLSVLGGYRDAFSTLDPRAVAAVWPSADLVSLQKQFAAIDDQNLEFEQCQISIVNVSATASCTGVVESGFRPGQRRLRSRRAQWQFTLEKTGNRWLIRTASGGRS